MLQAILSHVRANKVQQIHRTRAAAAEAEIETTATSVEDQEIRISDLKTGIAHVYGVRGSPEKVWA